MYSSLFGIAALQNRASFLSQTGISLMADANVESGGNNDFRCFTGGYLLPARMSIDLRATWVLERPRVQGCQLNSSGGLCIAGDCKTAWSQVGGGAVTSVFGRTGAVVAAANDYSFSQLSGTVNLATQVTGVLPVQQGSTLER